MKISFLYDGLHPAHGVWAKSLGAEFVSDRAWNGIPNLARFIKSFTVLKDIPQDTDVLLCESGAEILAGALWKRRHPKGKLVLIVDDPKLLVLPKMHFVKRRMYLWALSFYDMFLATSDFIARYIPAGLPGVSKVVPLFVDDRYRHHEPVDLGKKNVIFVGRVGEEKGVDQIVDAFYMLEKDFPKSRLYIVGDGPLKRKLEKGNGNIVWTGSIKDPEKYFLKGSIYMNLARIEPFGIAILEAMCLGLVPILTENIGVVDFVKKVDPELIVKNAAEAAEVAKRLWTSPELHREYSNKCREVAREFSEEYSVNKFKKAMAGL